MTTIKNNPSAVQQFAETFGSMDELLELFDHLLARITSAYSGSAQENYHLVGDYDFIYQLKQALKADLQNVALPYAQAPYYGNTPSLATPPKVSSIAQAMQIAEAKGIRDFRAVKLNDEYVLLTDWTQSEVSAYQASVGKLWGSFSDEGVFMIRFLHLMQDEDSQ
ncbi:hypothetical protein [Microscilla marina]|uniref:Uncharacterized protein n=1 Tax=Microscilla marina ATCC 23134 TaxID=313606 RepID=A1ZQT7_MICM2|nr:hypothetical protein [Microscilla marina]EAY27242.1 hypothetical protein M23134_06552 [Microscilla marina ATCC 23134]